MKYIEFRGFRGFCNDINSWVYGSLVEEFNRTKSDENGKLTVYYQIYSKVSGWYCVETESVGQSTGLIDKNGNYIFEGDIVSNDRSECDLLVIFEKGQFALKPLIKGKDYPTANIGHLEFMYLKGNAHQNPELIYG
jgi:hypothetical protein